MQSSLATYMTVSCQKRYPLHWARFLAWTKGKSKRDMGSLMLTDGNETSTRANVMPHLPGMTRLGNCNCGVSDWAWASHRRNLHGSNRSAMPLRFFFEIHVKPSCCESQASGSHVSFQPNLVTFAL